MKSDRVFCVGFFDATKFVFISFSRSKPQIYLCAEKWFSENTIFSFGTYYVSAIADPWLSHGFVLHPNKKSISHLRSSMEPSNLTTLGFEAEGIEIRDRGALINITVSMTNGNGRDKAKKRNVPCNLGFFS